MNDQNNERRNFIKKAAYIAPAVLTLSATPSFAQSGSGSSSRKSAIRATHGSAAIPSNGRPHQAHGNNNRR